jgi:hypothetical protein
MAGMRDFILLFVHVIVTMARLAGPGGLRSVVAESALLRHQLLILNRGRKRAPNLRATDRITAGLFTLLIRQARILRSAIVLKPSTLEPAAKSGVSVGWEDAAEFCGCSADCRGFATAASLPQLRRSLYRQGWRADHGEDVVRSGAGSQPPMESLRVSAQRP